MTWLLMRLARQRRTRTIPRPRPRVQRRGSPASTWSSAAACCAARCMSLKGRPARGKRRSRCTSCWPAGTSSERCLWITTAETPDELRAAAHAHGWSLEGMEVLALPMVDRMARPDQRQTLFRPAHVELDETMQEILTGLAQVQPERVVLDSLSLLRDMADEPLAYRRQVLALKQALRASGCTALVTDEVGGGPGPARAHAGARRGAPAAGRDDVRQPAAAGGNREDARHGLSQRPA